MSRKLIRCPEAAQLAGVTTMTIRNWIKAGTVKGFVPSRISAMVDADDLARLLKARAQQQRAAGSGIIP